MSLLHELDRHILDAQTRSDSRAARLLEWERAKFKSWISEGVIFELPSQAKELRDEPDDVRERIKYRIRQLRLERNETLSTVAKRSGLSESAMSKIEAQNERGISYGALSSLSLGLETSVSYLVGETNDYQREAIEIVTDMPFFENLSSILVDKGMSKGELAQVSNLTKSAVYKLFSRKNDPSLDSILAFSSGLQMPIGRLFGEVVKPVQTGTL